MAGIVTPYLLDNLTGSRYLVASPLVAIGICFLVTWVATLMVGIKMKPAPAAEPASKEYVNKTREAGTVRWFNVTKGFGFISREQGEDVFVHFRSIKGDGYKTLMQGQQVEFFISSSAKGLQAEEVIVVDEHKFP